MSAKILSENQEAEIVNLSKIEGRSGRSIAEEYGVHSDTIYRVLHRNGVDSGKNRSLFVTCETCGKEFLKSRRQVHRCLHIFCSKPCYFAFLDAGNCQLYIESSSRISRSTVKKYFNLSKKHIVHHEDRNGKNNEPYNLRVFADIGDHVRYHRGYDVVPIWDGRTVAIPSAVGVTPKVRPTASH